MRFHWTLLLVGILTLSLGCEPIKPLDESTPSTESTTPDGSAPTGEGTPAEGWKNAERVKDDARKVVDATFTGDIDMLVRLSHSKAIEQLGGEKEARQTYAFMVGVLKKTNAKKVDFTFTKEPQFLESESSHFVVLPTRLVISIGGSKAENKAYYFGQKSKAESEWKYLDSEEIHEENVQEFFPDFPEDFQFPEVSERQL